jgi:uncharacterized protein YecT (DUF1311 family)
MREIITFAAGVAILASYSLPGWAQSPEKTTDPIVVNPLISQTQNNETLMPRGNEKPSFDCERAKAAAARLICADAELAKLDGELGAAFQKRKGQLSTFDQQKMVADEIAWIRDRNTRCNLIGNDSAPISVIANSKPCIVKAVRERIAFLTQTDAAATSTADPPQQSAPAPSITSSQSAEKAGCESLLNKQSRTACFEHSGVPVIDCGQPRNADDVAFCREVSSNRRVPTGLQNSEEAPATACDTYAGSDPDPHHVGMGVPVERINPALAIPACVSALQQYPNSNRLIFELGRAYHRSGESNYALSLYEKAANRGYGMAQNNLGALYATGQGVPQNYPEALKWYRKAADQGIAMAQRNLGALYANGNGVPQDYSQAESWFRKAADQGDTIEFRRC